jgi:hypothetical protein
MLGKMEEQEVADAVQHHAFAHPQAMVDSRRRMEAAMEMDIACMASCAAPMPMAKGMARKKEKSAAPPTPAAAPPPPPAAAPPPQAQRQQLRDTSLQPQPQPQQAQVRPER